MTISPTSPRDIKSSVSCSPPISFSTSPSTIFHSLYSSSTSSFPSRNNHFPRQSISEKQLKPFATEDIKILLLENIDDSAREILESQGYQVEFHRGALPEEELMKKIKDVHVIGIRSKTKLTANVLKHAKNLLAVGCFCIGTSQVDLPYAARAGTTVFNSPFANSRSVAELVIAEVIILARQLTDRSAEMHAGIWKKVSSRCWEVRGKTLGIIGYGHIGAQLSVLAEALGMNVLYYDLVPIMALGKAKQVPSLDTLLVKADFLTLHIPELPETINLIGAKQLALMKTGSYLINASRGSVVNYPALIAAMRSGHIAGAALDVFPAEPAVNGATFNTELNPFFEDLRTLKNLILTPHIGGSTEEAQKAIGEEVAESLVRFINAGSTVGAVNMPEVALRGLRVEEEGVVRVIFVHLNRPGVLRQVNEILADHNVDKQMSDSRGEIAYLMADISDVKEVEIKSLYESLETLSSKILTRMLY